MFDSRRTIRGSVPRIPFREMAEDVLGTGYELSLVLCGDALAQRMNREYRKKTYYPNVLSFPLDKRSGEIFLNLRKAAREARQYRVSVVNRSAFLFVHALWHLKGFDHGDTMDRREDQTLKKFGFDTPAR